MWGAVLKKKSDVSALKDISVHWEPRVLWKAPEVTRLPLPDCHAYTYTHTHRDLHTHTEDSQNVIRRLVSCVVSCQLVIFQSVHSTGQRRACWDVTASKMESCHYFSPHLLFWFPKRQQTNKHINKQSYKHSQCLKLNMKNVHSYKWMDNMSSFNLFQKYDLLLNSGIPCL